MPDSLAPVPLGDEVNPEALLHTLLAISLTGVILLRPIYAADGMTIVDLAWVQLNPAAQLLLRLPARPTKSFLALFPTAQAAGVFDFYCAAFWSGQVERRQNRYQHDGLDGYYLLVAQRQGALLAVSFTDTNEHPRSAVQEELRQSQARESVAYIEVERQRGELDRLFTQAPIAMALLRGPNYVIELANETMATVWGRPLAQVLGQPVFEALPYVRNQGFETIFADVLAQGTPYDLHEVPVTIDRAHTGQPTQGYFNLTYRPQRDAQGHITGIITSAHEVTEQVRAHQQVELLNQELEARVLQRTQQLTAQQGLLSQILGQVPAAIATLSGPEHRYSFFNELYQGFAAGRTALGQTVREVFPEVVEQGIISLLDQVYHSCQPFIGTEILLMLHEPATGQAEQHYIDFTYLPLLDGQQRAQGILIFVLDVTDKVRSRKQAETLQTAMLAVVQRQAQERETQQAELRRIFEQAPVAIGILRGTDFVIELANATMRAIWGRTSAQLLGRPSFEAVPETAGQGLEALFQQVLTTGKPAYLTEIPVQLVRTPAGQPTPGYFDFVIQPLYAEQGQLSGLIAIGAEVTEQVLARQQVLALNQELSATNTRLLRTNEDLDTFVYTASHDLKAPIANIEGLLHVLREYLPTEAQEPMVPRLVGMMEGAIARFQQTVGHLTDIAYLQDERASSVETVDLATVLEDVRLDLLPLLESTRAELVLDLQECSAVPFSVKNLRSVLFNLLSNAVKYRAPGRLPRVQVRTHCTATQLVLEVQDNGLGLATPQQGQLFMMFRRLHTHVEGSGVGLYLIKRTLENAGGTITVRSELGIGSTFTVTIPRT
jgi:PAS domain S-box-containing protein